MTPKKKRFLTQVRKDSEAAKIAKKNNKNKSVSFAFFAS